MKATLHDELMREAGFESDYELELRRRRGVWRNHLRAVRWVARYWDRVLAALWTVAILVDLHSDFMSNRVAFGGTILLGVVGLVGLALPEPTDPRVGRIRRGIKELRRRVRRSSEVEG